MSELPTYRHSKSHVIDTLLRAFENAKHIDEYERAFGSLESCRPISDISGGKILTLHYAGRVRACRTCERSQETVEEPI